MNALTIEVGDEGREGLAELSEEATVVVCIIIVMGPMLSYHPLSRTQSCMVQTTADIRSRKQEHRTTVEQFSYIDY